MGERDGVFGFSDFLRVSVSPWFALASRISGHTGLQPRPLPSTAITRLPRYYGPLRHPERPGLSLAGCRLEVTRLPREGLPVLRPISLCRHAAAHTPAGPMGLDRSCRPEAAYPPRRRPSLDSRRVGSCITRCGACSAFPVVAACLLAKSPKATLYTGGFRSFVTSTTAPIATGRSDSKFPGRNLTR